jgi:hypothetical protein
MVNHYPPPNNPNIVKVAMIFQRDTREFVNTFHVHSDTGWNVSSMTTLANSVVTWWTTVYRLTSTAQVALAAVQVRLYDPLNPLAVDIPVSPPVAGTRGTTAEAGNVSVAMSERTGLAGRAFRGRIFAPCVGESDVTITDTLISAAVVLFGNAIANLVFGALPAGNILHIFHRPGLVPKPRDNTSTPVITYVVESLVDSQRRRLSGRGK